MSFWSSIKSIGKSIGHGIRKVGKAISSVGRPIHRAASKAFNFVKHIPVVGEMVSNSPVGGAIQTGLDVGGKILNVTDKAGDGDFLGAGKAAANAAGLRI